MGPIWAFQRWGQTNRDQGPGRGPDQDQEPEKGCRPCPDKTLLFITRKNKTTKTLNLGIPMQYCGFVIMSLEHCSIYFIKNGSKVSS